MKFVAAGVVAALAFGVVLTENHAGEKAKYTIAEVMEKAHKSGLWKKVYQGKADQEEKDALLALYTALAQNTPPKGEEKEWKKVTGDMVKAAKAAASGDEKIAKTLEKLVSCGMCHKKFKG
jgi:hypothetical protein